MFEEHQLIWYRVLEAMGIQNGENLLKDEIHSDICMPVHAPETFI